MKIFQLFSIYSNYLMGDAFEKDVTSICIDSNLVQAGSVFVAIKGETTDGHKYISDAVSRGAIAIVCGDSQLVPSCFNGAVVVVDDSKIAVSQLAAIFYNKPAEKLFCLGVTGTNGKTSINYMVEHILTQYGWPTG